MPKKKSKEDAAAPAAAPKLAKPSKAPKEPKAPKAPKEPKAKAPKADNAAGAKAKAAAGAGAGAGAASSSTGVVAPSAAPRPAGAGAGSSKAAAGPKKIATQGDADEVVLNYLTKLGKPVTLTLLDQNLHGALPKQLLQVGGVSVSSARDIGTAIGYDCMHGRWLVGTALVLSCCCCCC